MRMKKCTLFVFKKPICFWQKDYNRKNLLYFKLSVLYIDSIVIDRFHENVSSGHFYGLFQSTYIFLLLK